MPRKYIPKSPKAASKNQIIVANRISRMAQDECILWPYEYSRIFVAGRYVSVYSYICEARHGGKKWATQPTMHLCDNLRCCNPRHLAWAYSTRHRASIGRELSESSVRDLRRRGMMVVDIAEELRVPIEEVQKIMDRHGMRYL